MHSKKHAKTEEERIARRKASAKRCNQKSSTKQKIKARKQSNAYKIYDSKYKKAKRLQYRIDVLEMYGSKCICCGEANFFFLTLDHINNDGYSDFRGGGVTLYEQLVKSGIIDDRLQILCHNCNAVKELNRRALLNNNSAELYIPPQRLCENTFTVAKAKKIGAQKLVELIAIMKVK